MCNEKSAEDVVYCLLPLSNSGLPEHYEVSVDLYRMLSPYNNSGSVIGGCWRLTEQPRAHTHSPSLLSHPQYPIPTTPSLLPHPHFRLHAIRYSLSA